MLRVSARTTLAASQVIGAALRTTSYAAESRQLTARRLADHHYQCLSVAFQG